MRPNQQQRAMRPGGEAPSGGAAMRSTATDGSELGHERALVARGAQDADSWLNAEGLQGAAADAGRAAQAAAFPGYEIVRPLHCGGQGVVYLALQQATRRQVALKWLRNGTLASAVERARFEREVEILAQLRHPNVVTVHDSGVASGHLFYVMDYVQGEPLDRYVENTAPPLRDRLRLFATICDAVQAAHLKGVIHRDLKPANILIDAEEQPRVLDFGLARRAHSVDSSSASAIPTGVSLPTGVSRPSGASMTETGQFVGSLPWASPEQASGAADGIDIRSDVYSLGVVLYQMLTGTFPYPVLGNMRAVLENICTAPPARPRSRTGAFDSDVETIVLKCLAKERERRYQSAGTVAADVRRYLNGEPIEAKRESWTYVARKFLRRNWLAATLATGLLLAVIVGGTTSAVMWRRAQAHSDAAQAILKQLLSGVTTSGRPSKAAQDAVEQALNRLDRMTGVSPDSLARAHQSAANMYTGLDDRPRAYEHELVYLSLEIRTYGADSYEVQLTLEECAGRAVDAGDYVGAFNLGAQACASAIKRFGIDDERVPYCAVGEVLRKAGDMVGAERWYRAQLECIRLDSDPDPSGNRWLFLKTFAEFLHDDLRQDAEVEQLHRRALDGIRRTSDEGHQAGHLHSYAHFLRDVDRLTEAEELERQALEIRERVLQPGGWWDFYIYVSKGQLGDILRRQHRLEEAEPLLVEAYRGLRAHPLVMLRQHQRRTAERLAELYAEWDIIAPGSGYATQAAEWRGRAAIPPGTDQP